MAPDLRRLAGVLFWNRPVEAASIGWPPMKPWARRARIAVKATVLALMALQLSQGIRSGVAMRSRARWSALAGAYVVEEIQGAAGPAWQSLTVSPGGFARVQRADGSARTYRATVDLPGGTLALSTRDGTSASWTFAFQREGDVLSLDGTLEGAAVRARLRRLDETKWPLVTRGFHWVNEEPTSAQ
jgi:hypothetical protein